MSSLTRKGLAGAGITAAAVLIATGGPATAATSTFDDAVGDMNHGADIESVKVVNEKNVRVVIKAADLVRSYQSGAGVTVYVDTDPSDAGPEFAFLGGLFEGTDYGLVRTEGWDVPRHPRVVRGFHEMTLDYDKDVARIGMSRAALDNAGKVRVSVRTTGEQKDGDIVRDWLESRRDFTTWVAKN